MEFTQKEENGIGKFGPASDKVMGYVESCSRYASRGLSASRFLRVSCFVKCKRKGSRTDLTSLRKEISIKRAFTRPDRVDSKVVFARASALTRLGEVG